MALYPVPLRSQVVLRRWPSILGPLTPTVPDLPPPTVTVQDISNGSACTLDTTITVPTGGAHVVIMYTGWPSTVPSATPTLDSASADYGVYTVGDDMGIGLYIWNNVNSGTKTLDMDFTPTVQEGLTAWAYFVQDANAFGGASYEDWDTGYSTAAISATVNVPTVDWLILRFEQKYGAIPDLETDWVSLDTQGAIRGEYARASYLVSVDTSIVANGQNENYSTLILAAFEPFTGITGDLPIPDTDGPIVALQAMNRSSTF